MESLLKIKEKMKTDQVFIWRYATGVEELEDKEILESGRIFEK